MSALLFFLGYFSIGIMVATANTYVMKRLDESPEEIFVIMGLSIFVWPLLLFALMFGAVVIPVALLVQAAFVGLYNIVPGGKLGDK